MSERERGGVGGRWGRFGSTPPPPRSSYGCQPWICMCLCRLEDLSTEIHHTFDAIVGGDGGDIEPVADSQQENAPISNEMIVAHWRTLYMAQAAAACEVT